MLQLGAFAEPCSPSTTIYGSSMMLIGLYGSCYTLKLLFKYWVTEWWYFCPLFQVLGPQSNNLDLSHYSIGPTILVYDPRLSPLQACAPVLVLRSKCRSMAGFIACIPPKLWVVRYPRITSRSKPGREAQPTQEFAVLFMRDEVYIAVESEGIFAILLFRFFTDFSIILELSSMYLTAY